MIELKEVYLTQKGTSILRGVNLHVDRREFVCLHGPSGSGKSSILRLIHFDLFPTSGIVQVDRYISQHIRSHNIPLLRRLIGFIFQDYKLLTDRNVYDNVAFALRVTVAAKQQVNKKTLEALASVGMVHRRNALPHELSGGECQRVSIARAIALEPFILLADEPTGNLDKSTAEEIINLIIDINRAGTAVILSTHDEELASRIPFRKEFIRDGSIET